MTADELTAMFFKLTPDFENFFKFMANDKDPEWRDLKIMSLVFGSYDTVKKYIWYKLFSVWNIPSQRICLFWDFIKENGINNIYMTYGESMRYHFFEPFDKLNLGEVLEIVNFYNDVFSIYETFCKYLNHLKKKPFKDIAMTALTLAAKAATSTYFPDQYTDAELEEIRAGMNEFFVPDTYITHEDLDCWYQADYAYYMQKYEEDKEWEESELIRKYTNYIFKE